MEKDPQIKHRNSFPETEHPEIGKYHPPGHSFIMSKSPYEIKHACLLGADNEYVLKEIAGMNDEDITNAIIEGGIE